MKIATALPFLPQADALGELSPQERLATLKKFVKSSRSVLEEEHLEGQSGLDNCSSMTGQIDHLLLRLFEMASIKFPNTKITILATGGYGRGYLNPGSDLDLLLLLPKATTRLNKAEKEFIDLILYPLWDLGFKVGQACRCIKECLQEGRSDSHTRTTLFDARLLAGDQELFESFRTKFRNCLLYTSPSPRD